MNQLIADAIRQKRKLRFIYNGKPRKVEPQCYGIGTRGTELLRAYQPVGGSEEEPLFDLAKMTGLTLTDEFFDEPGPHYRKNDSAMVKIFCQL